MNIKINGSIGYTLLSDNINKVLVLADMHSKLPYCEGNDHYISDWFKSKYNNSNILLEEVPRIGADLKELWATSPHTQKLKELYLKDSNIINGVDVRPFLIPFSWELSFDEKVPVNMKLKKYLHFIDSFFSLKHKVFYDKLGFIYDYHYLKDSKIGKHYLYIKNIYIKFTEEYKKYLDKTIGEIFKTKVQLLEEINYLTSTIMEWFSIALIYKNSNKKTHIIHAGLLHTSAIIDNLIKFHDYRVISRDGTNEINKFENSQNGCLLLPYEIDKQFGGHSFSNFGIY